MVLENTLESPWTARRSDQSILKEINPEYSLEGLILKLKLQQFGHLMQRADSLEKTLMLGKTECKRRKRAAEDEMVGWHHQFNGLEFAQTPGGSKGQEAWHAAVHGVTKSQTQLSDLTATIPLGNNVLCLYFSLVERTWESDFVS